MSKIEFRSRKILIATTTWVILVTLFIAALLVYVVVLNSRTLRDEAIRTAEATSRQEAAVARCLSSRPILMRFSRHVEGVNDFTRTLVVNSAAALEATPRSDPQYVVRRKNLIRLLQAREDIQQIKSFPVPTKRECHRMTG